MLRGLSALSVALTALVILVPGTAVAAEPTSGYGQTPSTGTTTPPATTTPATTPSTTPSTGTLPAKEAATPTPTAGKEPEPAKASSSPTKTKATTLPFTGFDLRWDIGLGVLLMGAGFSIVAVQRRQRRESGR